MLISLRLSAEFHSGMKSLLSETRHEGVKGYYGIAMQPEQACQSSPGLCQS